MVPEAVVPKIKLKLAEAPKITLKFPGGKASPAESPAPPANGSGDNNTGINGSSRRNPFSNSRASATPMPNLDQPDSTSASTASPTPSNPAPVKKEESARDSPAVSSLNGVRGISQVVSTPGATSSTMAPPTTPGLPNSNTYTAGGFVQSFPHNTNSSFESKLRQPGQGKSAY